MDPENAFELPFFVALQTGGAAAPVIATIVVIRRFYSPAALAAVFARYKLWRLPVHWYLAAALLVPLLSGLAVAVHALLGAGLHVPAGSPAAEMGLPVFLSLLPLLLLVQVPTSPLLEELGWRGFLLPRLQERMGALSASVVVGLVWGVWHLPLVLAHGDGVPSQLLMIVAHTILMTWVFNSTGGSMLLMLVMHASLNVGLNMLNFGQSPPLEWALTWFAVVLVVALLGPRNLSSRRRVIWSEMCGAASSTVTGAAYTEGTA